MCLRLPEAILKRYRSHPRQFRGHDACAGVSTHNRLRRASIIEAHTAAGRRNSSHAGAASVAPLPTMPQRAALLACLCGRTARRQVLAMHLQTQEGYDISTPPPSPRSAAGKGTAWHPQAEVFFFLGRSGSNPSRSLTLSLLCSTSTSSTTSSIAGRSTSPKGPLTS